MAHEYAMAHWLKIAALEECCSLEMAEKYVSITITTIAK